MLVYADADSEVPMEWGDSDAREIKEGEKVQLRGFSTGVHSVGTSVSYRYVFFFFLFFFVGRGERRAKKKVIWDLVDGYVTNLICWKAVGVT